MKKFNKALRLFALAIFMGLAMAGMGVFGVAPILNKDRKLFPDTEWVAEQNEKTHAETSSTEIAKF